MSESKEIVAALNSILQYLYDSSVCFNRHVDYVRDENLKNLFITITHSRKQMIKEIQKELLSYGSNPNINGTLLGKTHMIFENIKNFVIAGDELSITKEVRRGENVLIDYYKTALKMHLPLPLRARLLEHLGQVEDDVKEADMLSVV